MRVGLAGAAHAARARGSGAGRLGSAAGDGRSEDRELFCELSGTATRARRAFPFGGPHQDFAVLAALFTMKFVDWHLGTIAANGKKLKGRFAGGKRET